MNALKFQEENHNTQLVFAEGFLKAVHEALDDVKRRYFFIGFRLDEANRLKYYETLGYSSIADLAEAEFGLGRSTAYGLMQVYNYAHGRNPAMVMDEKFKDYGYTQLLEMSKAKTASRYNGHEMVAVGIEKILTPQTSVSKIKEIRPKWDNYIKEYGMPKCETLEEFENLIRETELPAPAPLLELSEQAEPAEAEQSSVQPIGLPSYSEEIPAAHEPNFVDGEDYSQYEEEKPSQLRPEKEVIEIGLKGVDIYVKSAKYLIYERYLREPDRAKFAEHIKSVYNYDNKPTFTHGFYSREDNMNRTYDYNGIQFICFDPYQTVRLKWEDVAQHISELIYTDNYLSEEEMNNYPQWKSEQDGLIVNIEPPSEEQAQAESCVRAERLNFKNDKARREWLDNFRAWGKMARSSGSKQNVLPFQLCERLRRGG